MVDPRWAVSWATLIKQFNLRRILTAALVISLVTLLWEFLARLDTSRFKVIPAPSEIWAALIRTRETLLTQHIPQTLTETVLGLAIAFALGVILAALLDFSPTLRGAIYPLLVISQTIPIIAIAPLLIFRFGFGIEPKVTVVVLFCFFPIAVATLDGLTATDPDLVALLRAMGASRGQVWRKARLPSALPSLFSGLRIAATYSVTGAVVGEYIGSQYGLGYYLRLSYNSALIPQAFASILIITILSIALVSLVGLVERIALPWYFTEARESQWNEPGIY